MTKQKEMERRQNYVAKNFTYIHAEITSISV